MVEDQRSDQIALGTVIAALPLVVAWIYFVGRNYLESYYATFGAQYSFIQPNLNDALVVGAKGQFGIVVGFFLFLIVIVLWLLMTTLVGRLLSAVLRRQWHEFRFIFRFLHKPSKWMKSSKIDDEVSRASDEETRPSVVSMVFFFSVLLAASVAIANFFGQSSANTQIRAWSVPRQSSQAVVATYLVGDQAQTVPGQLVGCGDGGCVFWTSGYVVQIQRASLVQIKARSIKQEIKP
jgi:hypothetical protein